MNKFLTKVMVLGAIFAFSGQLSASMPEEQLVLKAQKTKFEFEDGCVIEKTGDGYKVEDGDESLQFTFENKPVFDYKTGEVVVEFSGVATDKIEKRSWAEAVFDPNRGASPAHFHKVGTESYYVTSGNDQAFAIINGIEHMLKTGAYVKIMPNQVHSVVNRSTEEALVLLVKCVPAWTFADHNLVK